MCFGESARTVGTRPVRGPVVREPVAEVRQLVEQDHALGNERVGRLESGLGQSEKPHLQCDVGERGALDQLHREERRAGPGGAGVEHLRDVRVVHHGQRLTLGLKASQDRLTDPEFATTGPEAGLDADRPTRVRYQVLAAACSLAVITYIHRVGFASASGEAGTRSPFSWAAGGELGGTSGTCGSRVPRTVLFTMGLGVLPPKLYSHGSSVLGTVQQVGGAMGTALAVMILSSRSESLLVLPLDIALSTVEMSFSKF